MHIERFMPHAALTDYVDNVFVVHIDFLARKDLAPVYPFLPTHTRFLCFYLRDPVKVRKEAGPFETKARSVIIGPQLTPVTLDMGQDHEVVVVNLKPAGLYRLLGIPMHEMVDCDHDARLVLGPVVDEVLGRLHESRNNADKNAIVQQFLLNRLPTLRPALPFDLAILQQVQASGNLPMDVVAAQACLSVRQFERKSYERLGFSPKFYSRLVRFSHACKFKESAPDTAWIQIAHRCGYHDQMHLVRDFKFFAKVTPNKVSAVDAERSVLFRSFEDLSISFESTQGR